MVNWDHFEWFSNHCGFYGSVFYNLLFSCFAENCLRNFWPPNILSYLLLLLSLWLWWFMATKRSLLTAWISYGNFKPRMRKRRWNICRPTIRNSCPIFFLFMWPSISYPVTKTTMYVNLSTSIISWWHQCILLSASIDRASTDLFSFCSLVICPIFQSYPILSNLRACSILSEVSILSKFSIMSELSILSDFLIVSEFQFCQIFNFVYFSILSNFYFV